MHTQLLIRDLKIEIRRWAIPRSSPIQYLRRDSVKGFGKKLVSGTTSPVSMKKCTYDAIVSVIQRHLHDKGFIKTLQNEFPRVSEGTFLSIYSQMYQQYTKSIHGSHRKPERMKEYYLEYLTAESCQDEASDQLLLCMARKVNFSPSLFSRIILEEFILSHNLLPPTSTAPNVLVSQWMKDPSKIPDVCLRDQVKMCVVNDVNYGPLAENIKHSVGYEYEFLLKEKIEALGTPYLDEKALRQRGYDKTPDFKLEVPFSVGEYVVNWVESKASFGDKKSHERYLEDQYWSYQNRFGSGLVIYWFGYVEELDVHAAQGIRLMDQFPDDIHTLPDMLDSLLNSQNQ